MMDPANFKPAVRGAVKAYTIWAAAALLILSNIAPLLPDMLAQLNVHPKTIQVFGTFCAILMGVLRLITTQSLADLGSSSAGSPPPPAVKSGSDLEIQ